MKYLVENQYEPGCFWTGSEWDYWQEAMQFATKEIAERIAAGKHTVREFPETQEDKKNFLKRVASNALDCVIETRLEDGNPDTYEYELALIYLREQF